MANRDIDDEEIEEIEEEEAPRRSSPLRMILLILLALVGLCVICFLGSRLLGNNLLSMIPIPGLSPGEPAPTTAPIDTPVAVVPTDTPPLVETGEPLPGETTEPVPTEPVAGTGEPLPATEQVPPVVTEEPATGTEEPTAGTEEPAATQEPLVTTVPTDELVDEHGHEMPTDEPTATVQPVPGPTATPAPGSTPQDDCSANTPPTADAGDPATAMMGKGQAFVTFDGSSSSDADGTIYTYEWDFGDGETDSGQSVTHGYSSTGAFEVTLTVTDNCGATGEDRVQVTVTGPTPPAPGTGTPTATAQPTAAPTGQPTTAPTGQPSAGTMGFCYRVQPGNTLTGIAGYFGVPLLDLAEVNGVGPEYYVIAGQGLFIPNGQIQAGPNVYEVQSGDTLNSIAFQCGLSAATLASANGLSTGQSLTPGQLLGIPLWSWY
ncbi:MAG: PKD domain-containing protein [Anaerolineae bacterium]|nr:PKD domain-containing protein [Anaerolineae bacterium]